MENQPKVYPGSRNTTWERDQDPQPVFGILCRIGPFWAEGVDDVEAETHLPLLSQKAASGSIVCSDTRKAYTGIAARGYVHRLVNYGERQYSEGKGYHINGLEGFWGYLKRKLASKGGIRKERLHLFLENTSGDTIIGQIQKG